MKLKVPIEEVKLGDYINGKRVVEVLRRFDVVVHRWYVRIVLEGGRDIIDGYFGTKTVEIERP